MSSNVNGTTITLTRGDTFEANISIAYKDGDQYIPYVPQEGDVIRFATKRKFSDKDVIFTKIIDNETLMLRIDPEDTKKMSFGKYKYDIQLTRADGRVDTFITEADLIIGKEVD